MSRSDATSRRPRQLLNLMRPIYAQTAKNGHFGHPDFSWEKTDRATKRAGVAAQARRWSDQVRDLSGMLE